MRLIDADALMHTYESEVAAIGKDWTVDDLATAIETAPTIDAIPVEHGHWQEYHTKARGYGKVWYQHECTPILYESPYYYCPNCGAKMDEKREVVL